MEYTRFVELRTPIWDRFEEALARAGRLSQGSGVGYIELEELAFDYRRILHDHALASARYADTSAARRLQRLAAAGTRLLRRDQASKGRGLLYFLTRAFPTTFRRRLPEISVAVGLFLAVTLLGLALTLSRPSLGLTFVGPGALEGLRDGKLWTESLNEGNAPAMAAFIGTNNIKVALMGWAGGLTAGILTVFLIFFNGLMLGSVVGLTLHHSMHGALLNFISAHGPLEISMILVCAGAGLVVARGLVAAEDRPRSVALWHSARDSFILLAGCLPWLALLAVVESFISPADTLSGAFKLTVGLALEALFLVFAFNPFLPSSTPQAVESES